MQCVNHIVPNPITSEQLMMAFGMLVGFVAIMLFLDLKKLLIILGGVAVVVCVVMFLVTRVTIWQQQRMFKPGQQIDLVNSEMPATLTVCADVSDPTKPDIKIIDKWVTSQVWVYGTVEIHTGQSLCTTISGINTNPMVIFVSCQGFSQQSVTRLISSLVGYASSVGVISNYESPTLIP